MKGVFISLQGSEWGNSGGKAPLRESLQRTTLERAFMGKNAGEGDVRGIDERDAGEIRHARPPG